MAKKVQTPTKPAAKPAATPAAKPATKPAAKPATKAPAPRPKAGKFDPTPVKRPLSKKQFDGRRDKAGGIDLAISVGLLDVIAGPDRLREVSGAFLPDEYRGKFSNATIAVLGANARKNEIVLRFGWLPIDAPLFPEAEPADSVAAAMAPDKPSEMAADVGGEAGPVADEAPGALGAVHPDNDGRIIPAVVKTADGELELHFETMPYFRSASDADVLALAEGDWEDCVAADEVLEACLAHDDRIQQVYDHVEKAKGDRSGSDGHDFDIKIDGARAMAWLRLHRTSLSFQIKTQFPYAAPA